MGLCLGLERRPGGGALTDRFPRGTHFRDKSGSRSEGRGRAVHCGGGGMAERGPDGQDARVGKVVPFVCGMCRGHDLSKVWVVSDRDRVVDVRLTNSHTPDRSFAPGYLNAIAAFMTCREVSA
jgi:hypothetical protein